MKANIELMKNDIKELVKVQIDTKGQRKTVRFTGTRTMDADSAADKSRTQKDMLRCHYHAYALLRGQDGSAHKLTERWDQNIVNKLLVQYKNTDEEAVCTES